MQLRTGIDLIEIHRVQEAIDRFGTRFLRRVWTPRELELFAGQLTSLAVRWAAKEAVGKAFGTGIGDISFQEIEILRGPRQEPVLQLSGAAQKLSADLGLTTWSISLSHTATLAIASVAAAG